MAAARRRRWLKTALVALMALGVVVALLPFVAGRLFGPAMAADVIGPHLNGAVDVAGVRLRWFGTQELRGVHVTDASGENVGTVDVTLRSGLLALALGGRDEYELAVRGKLAARVHSDGTTSLDDLFVSNSPCIAQISRHTFRSGLVGARANYPRCRELWNTPY